MARSLTPQDAHAIIQAVANQATGRTDITVTDTSSFVSAGEMALAAGVENTLNALGLVIGRTLMATRPYKAKLNIINAIDTGAYTDRLRKISFYSRDTKPAGDWNTNLYTNLAAGFTNGQNPDSNEDPQSTKSMWEQNPPVPLELNFAGSSVWQDSSTIYEYQLKKAFRSEEDFSAFVSGVMQEKANDIESQKEAFNRITLLNFMAGTVDMGRGVNLTTAYNTYFGTEYTTEQLLTTYLQSFLGFFVSTFKEYSDKMVERSVLYHSSPERSDDLVIMRHTPKDRQRLIMQADFFRKAEALVMPEIFNPRYLDMDKQFETVEYWQSIRTPGINVTPAIPDLTLSSATYGTQIQGDTVNLAHVLGILYDVDGMMTDYQIEDAQTTPLEARKRYRTIWYSFAKNAINDFTENAVVFYMADE